MLAFFIPGEPVAKGRPRFVRATGRTFTPKKTEIFEGVIAGKAADAMDGKEPLDGALRMTIRACYPHPKSWSKRKRSERWKTSKPDADNLAKICGDALNGIVYKDDAQIAELTIQKQYGVLTGLTITIEHLGVE